MKKAFIFLLLTTLFYSIVSCKKEQDEENIIKVRIAYDEDKHNKNQKLFINSGTAEIYWTNNSSIKLVGINNNAATFSFMGSSGNTANFALINGNMGPDNYIAFYPTTASVVSPFNITYSSPNAYAIDPSDVNGYISDNMLLYTKNVYSHGNANDTIVFHPAMTVLEIPLKSDSGSFIINTITLSAKGVSTNGAFINSARLPNVFSNNTNFSNITYTNTIIYNFTGNGLSVGTTPDTIKLLVWSADTAIGLSAYSIDINNGYHTKNITRTQVFSNSKYYKFPAISIPQPQTGDVYQGGIVCSTYVANGVTHGYVCAANDLTVKYPWSPLSQNQEISITTNTIIGSGETNTATIVSSYGNANYAARVCDNLSLNGFNDWFLPSQDEFNMIYNYLYTNGLANFKSGPNDLYWTSSQHALKKAVAFSFKKGMSKNPINKNTNCYIRPIRHF